MIPHRRQRGSRDSGEATDAASCSRGRGSRARPRSRALVGRVRAHQETNASTRPNKIVTLAKARVQKSRGGMATFAILDARLREHDEVSVDSPIPLRTLTSSPHEACPREGERRGSRNPEGLATLARRSLRSGQDLDARFREHHGLPCASFNSRRPGRQA